MCGIRVIHYNAICSIFSLQNSYCIEPFSLTVPPDVVKITGPSSVPVDETFLYRCDARNANPAPQIQWIVNGDVINMNSMVISPPSSSSKTPFSNNRFQKGVAKDRLHSTSRSSIGIQVTTQIHPPPPPSSPTSSAASTYDNYRGVGFHGGTQVRKI